MLGSAPSLAYEDFRAKVHERALLKATTLDTWGLLGCVMPQQEYLHLPGNEDGQHPIPDHPYPGLLDPTAPRAVQEAHSTALKRHETFYASLADLRGEILDLAGPWVVDNFLVDQGSRLLLDDVATIMTRLHREYSIKTPGQLKALKASLLSPLTAADAATVAVFFTSRAKTLASLAAAGQAVPPLDQIDQVLSACGGRGFVYIDEMIAHFNTTCLTPDRQQPEVLIHLITDRAKNEAPTASSTPTTTAFSAKKVTDIPTDKRPDNSKAPNLGKQYCYQHGYCGHNSADCGYMIRNRYTAEQRAATSPASVPGGCTTRRLFKPSAGK